MKNFHWQIRVIIILAWLLGTGACASAAAGDVRFRNIQT